MSDAKDPSQGEGRPPADATPVVRPAGDASPGAQGVAVAIEEFLRIELKVGTIRRAEPHPNADRLVVLSVDVGEPTERQIVAGIRAAYPPETLVGRQIVVVANLKPAKLRGVESRGMLLAASDASGLTLVVPDREAAPGSRVK